MSKKNRDDIKEIKIDYIETPRGKVPTIETIKDLISTWNELLGIMNNNLEKITSLFSELKNNLSTLELLIQKLNSKLDNLSKNIIEIKSLNKEIASFIRETGGISGDLTKSDEEVKEKAKKALKRMFE